MLQRTLDSSQKEGSHSIIFLALCDANYNFLLVDIGAPRRCSDGGVFRNSNIGKAITQNLMDLPDPEWLDRVNGRLPFYVVGDEAFPLLENLIRPYSGRGKSILLKNEEVFNYRLSRARRTIENTFGFICI
ncbi:uncharacterized protein LOC126839746 [Adelges cooleyi]|uniref:uncharacterized protein LOC126839746 n=1 Tax=Adelges cooleyi TaxID=133065 RepID=UPI00217FD2B8|nr:uncharacterized protein LOC126839746 [Adelges cooleyi]